MLNELFCIPPFIVTYLVSGQPEVAILSFLRLRLTFHKFWVCCIYVLCIFVFANEILHYSVNCIGIDIHSGGNSVAQQPTLHGVAQTVASNFLSEHVSETDLTYSFHFFLIQFALLD